MIQRYAVGDTVKLTSAPGWLSQFRNKVGEVLKVTRDLRGDFADVLFSMDAESDTTQHVKDVPSAYLTPTVAGAPKPKRRGVLNLHAPKDRRSEAQKSDEAKGWLESLGYEVLEVGKTRSAAKCYLCVSEAQRRGAPARSVRPTICPIHQRPVFSMDTGSTAGVPDWLIRHPSRWADWAILPAEWKQSESAERQPEQVALWAKGWYPFVYSMGTLAAVICAFEREILGIEPVHEVELKKTQAKDDNHANGHE